MTSPSNAPRWLNRTVLGIGLASLRSDWSHEIATTAMPALLIGNWIIELLRTRGMEFKG